NTEKTNELFSKLYKEAEKIKQWKLTVESELNQKERKLQENTKIIEAQKKAIQELQASIFENEKLRLKLEDEICENKDLLKETTASRHLCNLLKETCTHFTEKTSRYEQEKEETMRLYEELHSNIERMTVAFEELRVQAENDRLEMNFRLKEEQEKVDKFEKECKLEVSQKEKQISALTIQRDEKDSVIKDIKDQLQKSQNKIADLIEAKLHEEEMLKESQVSQEHLRAELEEAKISLQKAEVTQKSLETEFQTTVKTLIQVTGEKEAQQEECKKTKALLAALTEEFETSIANLKSLLQKEQYRLEKHEDNSKLLTLELQKKSAELEEMTKLKCDKEVQLEELSETLVNVNFISHCRKFVETEKFGERNENALQIRELTHVYSKLFLFLLQKEIHDLKVQLTSAAEKEQDYLKQLLTLKTDLEQEALKNEQLTMDLNKISLEKEQITQEKNGMAAELKKLQEKQEASWFISSTEKKLKVISKYLLMLVNLALRNELESLKEEMAKTGEEIKNKLDEREENVRHIMCFVMKIYYITYRTESKCKMFINNLKKQVENKTKCIEELQQENKMLKKKITAESKKNSIYEGKVNKLQLEMENMNKQHKEAVDIYQKDIETKKMNENKLHEEVEKMRLLYDEATMIQRETDIRCQHKITEMVALMEKHKLEYDKMIEERDAELKICKIKQQKQLSSERALENELSCLKSELSSLKEQLKAEIEEK
ncbi:SYCP1 protein, partial [Ifrita kowaldi]|nr:SYCP1 protein [Ifrita kowaldi]